MIIAIELSDEDWTFVCEELGHSALGYECNSDQFIDDDGLDSYNDMLEKSCTAERIDGYISTVVRNALERARPKFSEN